MTKRVYIDTSVVGGNYDDEFSFWTKLFFKSVKRGEFKIVISEILTQELEKAPNHIRYFLNDIDERHKEYNELTLESENLAQKYISYKIVGLKSHTDCRHIAIATVNEVEILTTWNFKHIVNLDKINLYNGVNLQNGYRTIEIRTPREIMNYENK